MKIYIVAKGELKEVNKPIFSSGDTYIVDDEKTIYIWLGKYCSVDEKTFAAMKARELDEKRGGAAKIITLDQGQEIKEFLQLIGGMKIVDKNLAKTMLIDVDTGDWSGAGEHVNTLYRVSSEEFEDINTMKFIQVPFKKESLDSEDCFIADLGDKIFIWQGANTNVKEKVKAGQWARSFDAERAGSQNEVIFEEGDDSEFMKIFEEKVETSVDEHVQFSAESALEKEKASEPVKEPPTPTAMDIDTGILTVEKPTGRRKCPKCGEELKYMIHEIVDKNNIIMDYPKVYGKKYKCGKCGTEWREK